MKISLISLVVVSFALAHGASVRYDMNMVENKNGQTTPEFPVTQPSTIGSTSTRSMQDDMQIAQIKYQGSNRMDDAEQYDSNKLSQMSQIQTPAFHSQEHMVTGSPIVQEQAYNRDHTIFQSQQQVTPTTMSSVQTHANDQMNYAGQQQFYSEGPHAVTQQQFHADTAQMVNQQNFHTDGAQMVNQQQYHAEGAQLMNQQFQSMNQQQFNEGSQPMNQQQFQSEVAPMLNQQQFPTDASQMADQQQFQSEGPQSMGAQSMGVQSMGAQVMGQQAMGQQAMGQQAMGQQAMGQQVMGQQAMGAQAMGQQGIGAQAMGQQGMGAQSMGPQAMGAQIIAPQAMGPQQLFNQPRRLGGMEEQHANSESLFKEISNKQKEIQSEIRSTEIRASPQGGRLQLSAFDNREQPIVLSRISQQPALVSGVKSNLPLLPAMVYNAGTVPSTLAQTYGRDSWYQGAASVRQHLQTPYVRYVYSHLL